MPGEHDLDCPEDDVCVRFVIPAGKDEATVSEALAQAFEACREADMGPVWMEEERVLAVSPTKTDVFVMDPFSGAAFDHLTSDSKFRCTVVGPRCLLACLRTNTPVPEMPFPLYTAAMRGLNVSFTGLDPAEKKDLKLLVERMSGLYSKNFHDGVTHLVAGNVTSEKYNVAVGKEIPVMTAGWVREVWRSSGATTAVTATEARFSSFRCPALLGVTVSVSKMGKEDKEILRKAVSNHGGQYSPSLEKDQTTVLVTPSASGDKYIAAKKWNIPCVTSNWVFESIEAGHLLPFQAYRLDSKKTNASTPTKQDMTVAGLAEVSMCSTILNPDETMAARSVEDTINSTALESGLASAARGRDTADWLKELELGKAKKAGSFLDGCKIYLSGFSEPDCVQLARILKFGGAARLAQLVESVTHVLHAAAEPVAPETVRLLAALQLTPHPVSLEWLVESMRRGRPVSEADYPFPPPAEEAAGAAPSEPAALPVGPGQDDTVNFEANLLAQYGGAKKDVPVAGQTSTMMTETMSQVQPFLGGLTIELAGFPEQQQQDLSDWINEAEGELVYSDHDGRVDYLILPHAGPPRPLRKHRKLVSELWLEDCLDAGELLEPQYFHRPALLPAEEPGPLGGVVTCLSGYSGREREFLNQLVAALGGTAQEIFAKRDNPEKKARGNTHLICPDGTGQKYEAAMKWRLPVVTADWLRACLRDRAWVSERGFLVGGATATTPGRPEASEEQEEVPEEEEDTVTNMSVEEIHRSYDQQKTAVESPMASMALASPATAVKPGHLAAATPGPADSPLATQLLRPRPINLTDITVTPQRWADSQPSPSQPVGQSAAKRRRSPGRGDGPPTPATPYGCHYTPEPSPKTRKRYKQLAGQMPRPELSELERRQAKDWAALRPAAGQGAGEEREAEERAVLDRSVGPEERDRRHQEQLDLLEARGLPVLERDERPFEEIMEERYKAQGKSWKTFSQDASGRAQARLDALDTDMEVEARASRELEGVTVCVAKKLAPRAKELHRVVEMLGGTVAWQLEDRVTHLVFTGKQNDMTKEFRAARDAGKQVVAPDWLLMCRDEARRVEEELFPHTYNPRLKLDITGCSPPLSQSMSQTSRSRARPAKTKDRQPSGQAVAEEVTADLAEMESLISSVSRTPAPPSGRKVLRARLSNQEEAHRAGGGAEEGEEQGEPEEKESQVLWRDPEEEEARIKLQHAVDALETQDMVGMETMETMGSIDLTGVMDKENKRNPANFVFMLSGMAEGDDTLEEAIKKLGGRMSEMGGQFDPQATHMITSKVSRSEKMLCSVASGRWVLHPSYIATSMERGRWLEEERFEWGDQGNGFFPAEEQTTESKLAAAARRWRQQGTGCEAFSGMKMVLVIPAPKRDQFQRLVEAGGGEVVAGRAPYSNTPGVTHLLTEQRYLGKDKVDYGGLAGKGVVVLKPLYLNDFLVSEQPPDLDKFMLEEFKSHWEKKKRSRVVTDTPTNAQKKTKSATGMI